MVIGGEKSGRRGGLGVWYSTKSEDTVKGEQTDFVATTPLPAPIVPPPQSSLRPDVSKLVYAIPTDTLKDITEEREGFPIRHALLKKHGRIKMYTAYRDAHVYFFPYWILAMMKRNEKLESVGEDVLGWWAKAGWQDGLGDKLGLRDILDAPRVVSSPDPSGNSSHPLDEDIDVTSYITTKSSTSTTNEVDSSAEIPLASRVRDPYAPSKPITSLTSKSPLPIPPILAYIQPSTPSAPLIRRVDTSALLLNISLRLAKLPALNNTAPTGENSPFAHPQKIAPTTTIPQQCRVESENSLIAENVTIGERCNIKESVVGTGCTVGTGAKLTKCILMDGAVVGDFVTLVGCMLGRRCKVEGGPKEDKEKTNLRDCEVQEGYVVPWGSKLFLSDCCSCGFELLWGLALIF
jgi:translation initiation factor eIF-2B subunit gamma